MSRYVPSQGLVGTPGGFVCGALLLLTAWPCKANGHPSGLGEQMVHAPAPRRDMNGVGPGKGERPPKDGKKSKKGTRRGSADHGRGGGFDKMGDPVYPPGAVPDKYRPSGPPQYQSGYG